MTRYGDWTSPISAARVAAGAGRLQQAQVHDGYIYWAEGRPEEKGRVTIMSASSGDTRIEWVPAPYSVRSKANGYGGGAFAVDHAGGLVYFVDGASQALYASDGRSARRVGGSEGHAYGDLLLDAARGRLLIVRERRHGVVGDGPAETLVAMGLNDGAETVVVSGHDFYGYPVLSQDGRRLAYLSWDQPDMPWDATTLWLAELDDDGIPAETQRIAGGPGIAITGPRFVGDHDLIYASDAVEGSATQRWQLYRYNARGTVQLTHGEREYASPQWVAGIQMFAGPGDTSPQGDLLAASTGDGLWRVDHLLDDQVIHVPLPGITQVEHLTGDGATAALIGGGPLRPSSLYRLDANGALKTLACSAELELDPAYISQPQSIAFPSGGETAHGFLYLPTNPDATPPPDTLPPLIVKCHGGPTSAAQTTLDLKVQYWTSRGFALLDLNYRGSTGYGRAYRERLYGAWGLVEVEDAAAGVRHLVAQGLVDPGACFISGSSAGGYTVLRALMYTDAFCAGACYYGVSDLEAICDDTTRFEARYGDRLIAPYPQEVELYRELSPIHHAEDLRRPVIFFQGGEDEIVPPDQTRRMAAALAARGIAHEEHHYPKEGHGFRSADTVRASLEAEYRFFRAQLSQLDDS